MIPTMAKRRKPPEGSPPPEEQPEHKSSKPNRTGVPLHVWLPDELAAAFQAYLDSTNPPVPKTSAAIVALKDFLTGKGFWPPKGQAGEGR